jgi:hypothetical protein
MSWYVIVACITLLNYHSTTQNSVPTISTINRLEFSTPISTTSNKFKYMKQQQSPEAFIAKKYPLNPEGIPKSIKGNFEASGNVTILWVSHYFVNINSIAKIFGRNKVSKRERSHVARAQL